MSKYYLGTVDSSSVADFLSINMTPTVLDAVNRGISSGTLSYDQMYIFGHESGPEAAFTLSEAPIVVPRINAAVSDTHLRRFASMLSDSLAGSTKIVIIDKHLADVSTAAFTEAGWSVKSHDKIYQTDLTTGQWKLDAHVLELASADLLSPAMLDFYGKILTTDRYIGDSGSDDPIEAFEDTVSDNDVRLFIFKDQAHIIAAATLFPTAQEEVGIHLLGVVPSERGKGIGGRLHAHVLAVSKTKARLHVGGTSADNTAMHKIFLRNGSLMVSEQIQLTL